MILIKKEFLLKINRVTYLLEITTSGWQLTGPYTLSAENSSVKIIRRLKVLSLVKNFVTFNRDF